MTYDFSPIVSQMIAQQLATGQYDSVDELIGTALSVLTSVNASDRSQEYDETVAAIREGLADVAAGRVVPLKELL